MVMGVSSSRNEEPKIDLSELQARMDKLEKVADLDGDGIVTKSELKEYTAKELQMRDSEIMVLRAEKVRLEQELSNAREELNRFCAGAEKETQKWIDAYDKLHKRHEEYLQVAKQDGEKIASTISNKAIDRFVDELLADPNINIYMLPDSIEKPLYTNTLKIILSIVQKMFNHTSLDIIGHQVTMQMEPTEETLKKDGE